MTTTEQRLADALRAVLPFAERDVGELCDLVRDDDSEAEANAASEYLWAARRALAAYDAQQAQAVAGGGWREGGAIGDELAILDENSAIVACTWQRGQDFDGPDEFLNARSARARIVLCVNAHDGLVAALHDCVDRLGVLIECDNEDHGGAATADVDAYNTARASLAAAGVQA